MDGGITMKTQMANIEDLIDYSEVYEVDQGNGVMHYTYMLDHPDTNDGKFFNIILKTYGSLEKVVMATYSMEEKFKDEYRLTGNFTNFTSNINFEIISIDNGFPCDEEPSIPIPVSGGSDPGGSNPGDGAGPGSGWLSNRRGRSGGWKWGKSI